jgi:hypothetical protein
MAVRPATRGGDGMLYGLIAFVIVSVASLGAFIWQLTNNKELQDKNTSAAKQIKEFGLPLQYYKDEAQARSSTVADTMHSQIKALANLISGKEDMLQPGLEAETRRALKQIADASPGVINPNDTLLTAITKLGSGYGKQTQQLAALKAERDELAGLNDQISAGNATARKEFEEQVAELRDNLARVEKEKDEAVAAKDKQFSELQTASEAQADEMNRARTLKQTTDREIEIEIARLKKLINEYQKKIDELRPSAFDVNALLTKADGRIMRAIPGSDVVYINLGSRDKLRAGMGFEVFSPMGERTDSDYRGKASIEIVTVLDTTAEARITRQTALKPIVEGDVIVNVAFEKNRKTKFVVRGDFDLDYDGETDFDGLERISGLIREWGGQVVPEVDESVDFVVVGTGPQAPDVLQGRPISSVVEDLITTRSKERANWLAVVEAAKARNIPVLTQTQFLFLTGERGGAFGQR